MGTSKRALAIVAFTTVLMGCSSRSLPATAPTASIETIKIDATTAVYPLTLDLTTAYLEIHPLQQFEIRGSSYQSLINNWRADEAPYFISNHLPADSTLWAAPIGQDAIVVIIHTAVGIDNLNTDQLRAIYQGHLTGWNDLGGVNQEIVVFTRENGCGTRAEFENMVMGQRQTTSNARMASSHRHMLESVATTPGSIGYVSMGYLDEPATVLAIDGVYPSQNTVFNHQYPLRSTVFVVGQAEPEDVYRDWVAWVQGPSGQAVVAQRYVPLHLPLPDENR